MMGDKKVFRTRSVFVGGHWHVRIFAADSPEHTFACLGVLKMGVDEFHCFLKAFEAQHKEDSSQ